MIVILTGGSAGIGKATAELLMSRGDTVYSLSRRGGEDVSDSKSGGSIVNIKADVTKPETLQAAVAEVVAKNGRVDALVCNAGNGIAGGSGKMRCPCSDGFCPDCRGCQDQGSRSGEDAVV